jgi:hypothetical protein
VERGANRRCIRTGVKCGEFGSTPRSVAKSRKPVPPLFSAKIPPMPLSTRDRSADFEPDFQDRFRKIYPGEALITLNGEQRKSRADQDHDRLEATVEK